MLHVVFDAQLFASDHMLLYNTIATLHSNLACRSSPQTNYIIITSLQTLGGVAAGSVSPWPMAHLDISQLKAFNARRKWHVSVCVSMCVCVCVCVCVYVCVCVCE